MKHFFIFDPQLLFYGFAIIFFASYGQTFFISIFNIEIRALYNLTDGEFGLIYAIGTLLSSFFLIGFAKLIDHIDLRLYSFIISVGLAVACLGIYISYNSIIFLLIVIFALRFLVKELCHMPEKQQWQGTLIKIEERHYQLVLWGE